MRLRSGDFYSFFFEADEWFFYFSLSLSPLLTNKNNKLCGGAMILTKSLSFERTNTNDASEAVLSVPKKSSMKY